MTEPMVAHRTASIGSQSTRCKAQTLVSETPEAPEQPRSRKWALAKQSGALFHLLMSADNL